MNHIYTNKNYQMFQGENERGSGCNMCCLYISTSYWLHRSAGTTAQIHLTSHDWTKCGNDRTQPV